MAWQQLPGAGLWVPEPWVFPSPTFSASYHIIDAAAEKIALLFSAPKTGTLESFEFQVTAFTQCTNGLKVSFQDPAAAAMGPDGTADQYRVATVAGTGWIAPGIMSSDGTDGGTKRSVTAGDLVFVVIEYNSFATSDALTLGACDTFVVAAWQLPGTFVSSWTASGRQLQGALKYDDGTYCPIGTGIWPASAWGEETFNSGTASGGDERGVIVRFPAKVKINGLWALVRTGSTAATGQLILYSDTTAIRTHTHNWYQLGYGASPRMLQTSCEEYELAADTDYRLVYKPTNTTNQYLQYFDVASQARLGAYGGGTNWVKTTRTDLGAWDASVTTRTYMMGVRVSAIDDGVGGAGGGGPIMGGMVVR